MLVVEAAVSIGRNDMVDKKAVLGSIMEKPYHEACGEAKERS